MNILLFASLLKRQIVEFFDKYDLEKPEISRLSKTELKENQRKILGTKKPHDLSI